MSCEIRLTSYIQQVPEVRRYLFPTDDNRGGDLWLQKCKISISPTADLIVIANERRVVYLTSKWDSAESMTSFQMSFSNTLHECDNIKAVLCLPIVELSQSSRVGPDWTCVVIGFDSGCVGFYTDSGELLFEEQFHNENIINIKCQSQHSPRPDLCPQLFAEEIYIHYQSNICVINGQNLFSNLRSLAKVQSTGDSSEVQLVNLNIKKWGFQDQSVINDVAVVGLNLSNTFDHLLTASTCGGFDSKYRNIAPSSTLVLTAGSKPYLGYHYALDGVNQPILSDVAKVVANKLKSALPGWLTGNKTQEKEDLIAMHPIENMSLRFGLCDLRRSATEIILSPNRKLATISDTLGRVVLVDCFKGIAIKLFKGYREAQCAFLQVPDERRSKHKIGNKVAMFLLIYSPKKGTLEIFTTQQGVKIAVFSASKFSKLLYISHGLLGYTKATKSRYICQFTCIFMDNDGNLKEIMVPFHYALAERNSKKARDIHLYKKLRQFIKTETDNIEKLQNETLNICTEIKSDEIKAQLLELLVNSKNIPAEVIAKSVNYFLENSSEDIDTDVADTFKINCVNIKHLLNLYSFVTREPEKNPDNGNTTETRNVFLELNELKNLQKLLDLATSISENSFKKPRVTFSNETSFTVSDFLNAFNYSKLKLSELKTSLEEDILFNTSEVIFKDFISGNRSDFDELTSMLLSSCIPIQNIFYLAIYYWVNRALDINQNLEKDMNNFSNILTALAKSAKKNMLIIDADDEDSISIFWEEIRDNLAHSSRPFPALMAALLCHNVTRRLELENYEDSIEILSQENIQWALLIGKLEDVSTLNIVLSIKPEVSVPTLPCLKYDKVDITLQYILENGKGSVSELTAQWLTSCGIDPETIVINEVIFNNSQKEIENDSKTEEQKREIQEQNSSENQDDFQISEGMYLELIEKVKCETIFKYLNLVKQEFPYSLEASTLLANMCWEYALAWRKSITLLDNLDAAIKCLNHIKNVCMKQGLFLLMWNTHLKIVLENTSKLINKVGKLPKERLCQQDTDLSDKQIVKFISICTNFVDAFLESVNFHYDLKKPNLKFEAIWENGSNQPLAVLAVQQKEVDHNLLHLHYQLSVVLQMITHLSVKHSKPLNNLFEASIANLFFTDLQRKLDINWNKTDIKINASRLQFLYKVIIASLETVTLNENGEVYCAEHVDWMQKCILLARIWNLNIDEIKRFQVIHLYICGFDIIAQELTSAINELNILGEELLKVAGKRMSKFLSSSPNYSRNITAINPLLSLFINSLNGEWCSPSNIKSIKVLASQILTYLDPEISENYKLAELLLDSCITLEEFNS